MIELPYSLIIEAEVNESLSSRAERHNSIVLWGENTSNRIVRYLKQRFE